MYQEIRFANQDACFFKSRRETTVFDQLCFREGLKTRKGWNLRWLLIVSIFQMQVNFSKVCSPFCSTAGTEWKKILMGGTQNFLQDVKTNINALQCDLWVMYGRVTESAQENQLTQDLELLMQVMDSRLQSLAKLNSDFHYQGTTEESSTTQNSQLFTLERSGNAERPRYEIRQEQIHGLREALGFRWVDIARMLGMSPRTLSRRRQEFGMPLGQQHNFSSWSDTWTILWEAFFQLLHCEFSVVLDSSVLRT